MQLCSRDNFLLPTFDTTIQLPQQSRARLKIIGLRTITFNLHCGFHNMLTRTLVSGRFKTSVTKGKHQK